MCPLLNTKWSVYFVQIDESHYNIFNFFYDHSKLSWMTLMWCLVLNEHTYLSGKWLGLDLRMDTN